ncbi:MAG: hypothetical protein GY874_14280 [Desulfobacteraceae bacterium]|nr:hypothetical protein [Desulfobacteraceae bacterium]
MDFFPFLRRKKQAAKEEEHRPQLRPNHGQGPFTQYFKQFVPRKLSPELMEFLRESIPIVDAAINRLVSLDGHIEIKGNNEALVQEIKEWWDSVPVNNVQKGVQAFHQNLSAEAFEQGFALGEFVANKQRNDIAGLRVADSKFIKFRRNKEHSLEILQKSDDDHDYRLLRPESLMYFSIYNENQNPYGTPLMRSCEFVSKIFITIQNAQLNVWERFGDPSYSIIYKTSKKDGKEHEKRKRQIEKEFAAAIRAKRGGDSADFIRVIDTNSDIIIKVIGADGQVLEMEVPSRHVLEQIVAKTGLPPWMLGLHWSTTERLSNAESEMLLADVATRRAAKLPLFTDLVRNLLLLRGKTWKPGDWHLEWAGVNLRDVVSQAQARFLNAQADMYYLQNASEAGIQLDINDLAIGKKTASAGKKIHEWRELDRICAGYEDRLKSDWRDLLVRVKALLGLEMPKEAKSGDEFSMSAEQHALVLAALENYLSEYKLTADNSPIVYYYGQAYSAGLLQAARMLGFDAAKLSIIKNKEIFKKLAKDGFDLVKNNATKLITNKILPEMEAFVIAGSNPLEVARRLEKLFENANNDWQRLASSEMAMAAESAKLDEWAARGQKRVEFSPAPDACPLCRSLAGEYNIDKCPVAVRDTHPRCKCSTRPAADKKD